MKTPPTSVVLALAGLVWFTTANADAQRDEAGEQEMLTRINVLRGEQGMSPLERHPGLDEAARVHSADMAEHQQLSHVSERTGDPSTRVAAAQVEVTLVGENIAHHHSTTAGALESVMTSEAHRAQFLDSRHTHIGLASVRGDDGVYITQVMATIAPPPVSRELPPPAPPVAAPAPPVAAPPANLTAPSTPPAPAPNGRVQQAPLPPRQQLAPNVGPNQRPPVANNNRYANQAPRGFTPNRAPGVQPNARPLQRRPGLAPNQDIPSLRVPAGHRRVAGYWLYHGTRWWYFPVPPGARPGQVLQPDARVQGPPPGYRGVQYNQAARNAPRAPVRYY